MSHLACIGVFSLALIGSGSAFGQTPRTAELGKLSQSLETVVAKVGPTVVQIRVTAYGPVPGATAVSGAVLGTQRSVGSGVILSADGFIVTNAHVIQGGRRFVVVLPRPAVAGVPGRSTVAPVSQEVPATLVGTDSETDLAVLKVALTDLPYARLGDSDSLAPGQVVLALGSPFGLASSVTMGVVSAVGRQLRDEDRMIYIQTDTPINPGNSGGPLVSVDGVVVGINTLIFSQSGGNEGIGFAAPANIVRFVFEQIRTNQRVRRGEIGVFAQTITPALAAGLRLSREWGVVLGDVYPNSPAARAGLRVGDVILSVDGKPMENGRQFDVTLYQRRVGTPVSLEVGRGLQRMTIRVPLVERRDEADLFRDLVNPEKNLIPRLGILGLDMTPELARMLPGVRQPAGVLVAGTATGQGAAPGPLPGDVIYAVNGTAVRTLADLRTAIGQLGAADPAVLQVGREGQLRFVIVTLE
ncbi:MAG TPA: trypsin-like peptidase domain-containing protein [Gemmatimonadales bacterium]|nr:trypsin-like peptidase domain-containing protein [Gemmatimonadales bacterium]